MDAVQIANFWSQAFDMSCVARTFQEAMGAASEGYLPCFSLVTTRKIRYKLCAQKHFSLKHSFRNRNFVACFLRWSTSTNMLAFNPLSIRQYFIFKNNEYTIDVQIIGKIRTLIVEQTRDKPGGKQGRQTRKRPIKSIHNRTLVFMIIPESLNFQINILCYVRISVIQS